VTKGGRKGKVREVAGFKIDDGFGRDESGVESGTENQGDVRSLGGGLQRGKAETDDVVGAGGGNGRMVLGEVLGELLADGRLVETAKLMFFDAGGKKAV